METHPLPAGLNPYISDKCSYVMLTEDQSFFCDRDATQEAYGARKLLEPDEYLRRNPAILCGTHAKLIRGREAKPETSDSRCTCTVNQVQPEPREVARRARVYWRMESDPHGHGRVTAWMPEDQARTVAAAYSSTPGVAVMECSKRPGGIELEITYESQPRPDPMPDTLARYQAKAANYGQRYRDSGDEQERTLLVTTFMFRVLSRVPESLKPQMHAIFSHHCQSVDCES